MMSFRQGLVVTSRNLYTSTNTMAPTVALDNMNPCIKKMQYAVRGPLVIRATAIEKVLRLFLFYTSVNYNRAGASRGSQEAI